MANTVQLTQDGNIVYPITDVSCVMGLDEGAITEAVLCWDGASTPVVANIPAGVVVTYNSTTYTGTLAASADTVGKIYMVATGTSNNYNRYMTFAGSPSYVWQNIGDTTIDLSSYATKAEVTELEAEIDGNDNSATLTKTVTQGSNPNGVVSFSLKAGTYIVTSPNFSTLLPSLTLYFRKEDNTNITNKTAAALLTGGDFVLSEDCYSVYFYGGNALASGDLQFVFTDKNKTSGLRGDIAQVRTDLEADIAELDNKIFDGIVNASFAQGSYYQGSPTTDMKKVRYSRLFSKTELPVIISIPSTCKAKLANIYYYSDPSDYTSFLSSASLGSQYAKGITLDSAMLPTGANGVTVVFENEDNTGGTLYDIAPEMMTGTTTKYRTIQDQVNELMPEGGISYYGKRIDVNITDQENKMQTETVVQHTPSSYIYSRYNQSMAIYNGLAFCFNDTQGADNCFCVVIDLSDGSVVTKIDTIPSVITAQRESHLNNANFTDVFFDPFDELPLLLLSRGDYADGSLKDQEMYIFRITPSGGSYVFTHIKTIKHRGTYYFNPSWEYDSQRKMIWGHNLIHGDWRFGNANYRKFNNFGLYFSAFPDTQYITIVSDEQAAENADITITVGTSLDTQTKTVSVQSGETIDPADFVMPYVLNVGGYSYIKLNQSADAFEGQYIVCACDANGDNRIPINFGSVLVGFPAPDLRDSTEVTINASDMTPEVEIDPGIFQGGCCFAGKLILPFSAFKTINGQAVTMGAQNCIVVDPTTGEIESVFPTGTLENQGCAVYDGKIYISSHNANAPSGNPSFDIVAYSF